MTSGARAEPTRNTTDWAVAAVVLAAVVAYLSAMPHNLGPADESFFLYEAKRVSQGEVLYRDVFELVAPLSWYAMAFLFDLFGASIETARASTAVLHGLIALTVYVACRRLGVARGLAVTAALAHVALCQPVWPYASPHWFGTLLDVALLALLLATPGPHDRRRWLAAGAVSGLLIGVQQQKGVALAAAAGATLVVESLIEKRFSGGRGAAIAASTALRLALLGAAVIAVVAPLVAVFAALAGAGPLYEALVRFPLENYRGTYRSAWAALTPLTRAFGRYTVPEILAALPLALFVPFSVAALGFVRRRDRERVRARAALVVIGLFSLLSIAYYPDLIHVAFVAPVLLVALADTLETVLGAAPALAWPRRVATSLLAACCALQLGRNLVAVRAEFPVAYDSAFGRIDLREPRDVAALDELRRLVDAAPSREVFSYPGQSFVYLVAGARNPTRFQFFSPRYNTRAQIEEVLAALEARKVPYVLSTAMFRDREDPIRRYIREHYERVRLPGSPRFWLLRRRAET